MKIAETDRLEIRWLEISDAAFILKLVNQPSWLRHIGDKGVKTIQDAENYILRGPVDMYHRLGFGMYRVELKHNEKPVGICGLIKRDTLDDIDLGFAFLPEYWGKGYAFESASAVMRHAKQVLKKVRVAAITTSETQPSIKLLEKLGFRFEREINQDDDNALRLFACP